MLVAKERFARMGISPREFRKCRMKDIEDILQIQEAWDAKSQRVAKITEAMNDMKR